MVPLLQHTLVILSQFIQESSASSSYVTFLFFSSSLPFVIARFVSQTFLMPGLCIWSISFTTACV